MKSMTGYGVAQLKSASLGLEVSLKSVNGRYFDPRLHLPKEYFSFEADIKKLIHSTVQRGTVDLYVLRRPGAQSATKKINVQTDMAKQWLRSYRKLSRETGVKGELSLMELASLSDVLQPEEIKRDSSKEKKELLATIKKALLNLDGERKREGTALRKELLKHLQELLSLVTKMKALRGKAHKELRKKVEKRLEKLGLESKLDPQRLAQEVVIQLDKTDIDEEISRLNEHLKSCKSLVSSDKAHGKKLDFFCQELLRETNTIGSKSQITELTHFVVDAKAVIERFREQVQNIE